MRHRNYRLFWIGQVLSLVGTWMQSVSEPWLVLLLGGSPLQLGIVLALEFAPSTVLAPIGGVLADRMDKRTVIIWTQVAAALQAVVLFAITVTGIVQIWHIFILAFVLGCINAVNMPVRQAFAAEMVPRRDLLNAIALNSASFNAARIVGPAIAGVTLALWGPAVNFGINAVSYIAVILALCAMKVPRPVASPGQEMSVWRTLTEGIRYVAASAPIRTILLLLSLVSLAGVPFTVLMPVFAADVLQGGPHTLGLLMGAIGVGALAGALSLAARKTVRGLGRLIGVGVAVFGASLVAFALSRNVSLSLFFLFLCGFGMMVHTASSNTILQTIVEDDKRGRVMSLYAAAFMGTLPLGSVFAGTLAGRIGATRTVLLGGLGCLAAAGVFALNLPALRTHIRPIYVRLGIIPELATGLQVATEPTVPVRGATDPHDHGS